MSRIYFKRIILRIGVSRIYWVVETGRAKTQGLSSEERWCSWQIEWWRQVGSPISPVYWRPWCCSLLSAEHNRKQFLEILFLMVSFRLLISDLRRKSVTILILCFLFEEWWCWWWSGCASRELKQVLVLRNQTNVSFFAFFFHQKLSFYLYLHTHLTF